MYIPDVDSEEHLELRRTVRRFVEQQVTEADVRRTIDDPEGLDRAVWSRMGAQLGLQGLALPEEFGGADGGLLETVILFEETGRALVPSPLLSTVGLAAPLLLALGDGGACKQWLTDIAAGELIAAVALPGGAYEPTSPPTVRAEPTADGWRLTGSASHVLDGALADLLLVVAATAEGPRVFAVRPREIELGLTPLATLDLTRREADIVFDDTPAEPVGPADRVADALDRALTVAAVALAAEQTGGAEHLMAMAVEYAKIRYQFGRAIGSFQAIKHKLAEMAFDVERMHAAVRHAATVADDPAELAVAAELAAKYCSEAFFRVAAETVQVHGGIGFTWEHPAHLYFRRAKASEYLLGSPGSHGERLLALLGV
ncbi:acyl-CoA dehydrogenase family protein [Pseudonocardia sp. RS010]|uniref:acyl-CoA dehydrogenase family protein n=1 Tax=Pseudonocardia sp. RS010 TaxID=3385979 RepID=UPI00399FDFDB